MVEQLLLPTHLLPRISYQHLILGYFSSLLIHFVLDAFDCHLSLQGELIAFIIFFGYRYSVLLDVLQQLFREDYFILDLLFPLLDLPLLEVQPLLDLYDVIEIRRRSKQILPLGLCQPSSSRLGNGG